MACLDALLQADSLLLEIIEASHDYIVFLAVACMLLAEWSLRLSHLTLCRWHQVCQIGNA